MSIKLRLRYRYRELLRTFQSVLHSLGLPEWMTGRFARLVVGMGILFFAVGYIVQVNGLATSGYEIHRLEKELAAIAHETQKLDTEVAAYQSIASIQKRLSEAPMVPVTQITYIKAGGEAVAHLR